MDTVDLNIPLMGSSPNEVILVARHLRAAGFNAPAARVALRVATGERMLVVRATHHPSAVEGAVYGGLYGALRGMANALNVEPISMARAGRPARFYCKDFSDERDGVEDPAFLAWTALPAVDGLAKV